MDLLVPSPSISTPFCSSLNMDNSRAQKPQGHRQEWNSAEIDHPADLWGVDVQPTYVAFCARDGFGARPKRQEV